jgi:hypothetical protein
MRHNIPLPETGMLIEDEIEHIREQLNASVYREAESWMLPSWVDLTIKGHGKKDALIGTLANNSYRNWSLIGGVGARKCGIADSRGLVTSIPDCGSIDVWILGSDGIIFPALIGKDGPQLRLVSSEDQLYEWKTDVRSVEFTRLVFHAEHDEIEYLYNEIVVKNIALEETSITFYVVVRPMSVLGFEPIEHVKFDDETNNIHVNDILALQVDTAPTAVYLVESNDANIPDLIQSDTLQHDQKLSSREGYGTAILRFDVPLSPAGIQTILFGSPLEVFPVGHEESRLANHKRDESIGKWYDFAEKRGEAIFPDEQLNSVFSQAAVSLAIHSQSVLFPENRNDSTLNWRDRMRILYALIKAGGIDVASQITTQATGIFETSDHSFDTTVFSPVLWGLLQLQGYSIQKESIQENIKFLSSLAENLITTLAIDGQQYKVDETSSESDETPLSHYSIVNAQMLEDFNEMLWNLAILKESVSYFVLTRVDLVDKIKGIVPLVEHRVQELFEEIQNARWPRPTDPEMNTIDTALLNILTSVVQLKIDILDKNFLRTICKKISDRRLVRNLWKTAEPDELFSSHLALRIAHFHVWDRQRYAAEPLFQRALEFMSEDFLLPEFVNPRTFGGSGGTGSSVMAAADIILLLSDMLVLEDKDNLVFLAGIPSEWYEESKPLIIKSIHTRFGKTRIDIGSSANQHQIETGMEILPEEIEIHVPATVPMRMIKAYGGSIIDRAAKDRSPHIKLVPLSNDVTLTYPR